MGLDQYFRSDIIILSTFVWNVEPQQNSYILSEIFEVNIGHLNSKW
jgi:hypothetical protein